MRPVCRWCYVVSRHRRNGPVGSLRVALACARSGHGHAGLRTPKRTSSKCVTVVLEEKAKPKPGLPPLPRTLIEDMLFEAERILALG